MGLKYRALPKNDVKTMRYKVRYPLLFPAAPRSC
jgi:hypothetical protein